MDYEFTSDPSERLKCLICLGVAIKPKQHEDCGKLFCSGCLDKIGNTPCPNCRSSSNKYFLDKRGKEHQTRTLVYPTLF